MAASTASEATVEVALDCACSLGESPVWDGKTSTLYFVDINNNRIYGYVPADKSSFVIQLDEPAATIVPTSDPDKILVATRWDVLEVDVPSRKLTGKVLASSPEADGREGFRFNDGKISPQGTFFLGRMSTKWREGVPGRVYRLDPGSSELKEVMKPEEVLLPNGMTWVPESGEVLFVDSKTEEVRAYRADDAGMPARGADGALAYRTLVSAPSGLTTVPDGITLDADLNVWVAHGESGEVTCYDGTTGAVLRRVALPVQRPTALTFGGPNLEELYVTTRVESGPNPHSHCGALLCVRVPGVKGLAPAYDFPLTSAHSA